MTNAMTETAPRQMTNPDEMRDLFALDDQDLQRINQYGQIVVPRIGEFVDHFYEWLIELPEFEIYFPDEKILQHVKDLQVVYWTEFFAAVVDQNYIDRRTTVGETHARIGLPLSIYFSAMNTALNLYVGKMYDNSLDPVDYAACSLSIAKLVQLDTAVVVDTYSRMVSEAVAAQSRALMEMSTPVTQIWEGILLLPLVGLIDSKRAQDIMNASLAKIAETQARSFILDISGVGVVDTAVANHLIKVTQATRLMGCECAISGVSPAIAQTIVQLGIDVGEVKTTANMRDALSIAFSTLDTGPETRG